MQTDENNNPAVDALASCPMCGAAAHRPLPVPGHWIGGDAFAGLRGAIGLSRCRECSLVFTNPRPADRELNAFYGGNAYVCHDTAGSTAAQAKSDLILSRAADLLPAEAPRSLLDYGAGGGDFLLHARSRGWNVQGFEPGRRGLETCRKLGLEVVASPEALPAGKFGLVTLHHVLEHIARPASALREIRRLLAPGGRLLVEVPNVASLRARLATPLLSRTCGIDERYRAFPIHLMYYTDGALRETLARSGWEVEETFTMGLGLDEFFTRPVPDPRPADRPVKAAPGRARAGRRLRHLVRDAILGMGLGENLVAIARPGQERPPPARG